MSQPIVGHVEGDLNALAIKVLPEFNLAEVEEEIPVGSHIIWGFWDSEKGAPPSFEGTYWTPDQRAEQLMGMRDDNEDARYSAVAMYVPPLTAKEASQIADKILGGFGFEKNTGAYEVAHAMLRAAAHMGRGVSST